MTDKRQIEYWAQLLDESRRTSYYDMYMMEHPEDKKEDLLDELIGEFAKDLKKDRIDLTKCMKNGILNSVYLDDMQKKLKHHYYWQKIDAHVYAAIVSRLTALLSRAKNQRFNEADEIEFDDVSHSISRKTVENCLDIICHNANVLEANNDIVNLTEKEAYFFKKHGIPAITRRIIFGVTDDQVGETTDYLAAVELYKAWASYGKGKAGEQYVCDSDYGPEKLKKVLSETAYDDDTIDLAVALNKCLDVVHFRSDLAAAFIEGRQSTCAMVSNLPAKFVV